MKRYRLLKDFLAFKAGTEILLVRPFPRRYSPDGNPRIGLELSAELMAQHPDIFQDELIHPDFRDNGEPQKYKAYCWRRGKNEKLWDLVSEPFYTKSDAEDFIHNLAINLHIPGEIDFEFPAFPGKDGLYYGPKGDEGDRVSPLRVGDWMISE